MMPIINLTVGTLTKEQKKELIERLVEVSSEVTGAPEQSHMVVIQEMPLDAVSLGKKTVEEIVASHQ